MLLCQISDPHVVVPGELAYGRVDTAGLLARCVQGILRQPTLPDAVLVTGDLVDHGAPDEYRVLARLLAPLPMPFYLLPGNHDDRDALRSAFPQQRRYQEGRPFIQYTVEDLAVRLIVLDSVVPQQPHGALCADRLGWLEAQLSRDRRPTLVALHHPPIVTGLAAMDRMGLREPEAFATVIARHPHVERVVCGHDHRMIHARFANTVLTVCPSAAHQLQLNLDPQAALGFTLEPSAFVLHWWNGAQLVSHTALAEAFPAWGPGGD